MKGGARVGVLFGYVKKVNEGRSLTVASAVGGSSPARAKPEPSYYLGELRCLIEREARDVVIFGYVKKAKLTIQGIAQAVVLFG